MEKLIGKVVHYFDKIGVAVIKVDRDDLVIGDQIRLSHNGQDFVQRVDSLQVDHIHIEKIRPGQEAGVKVSQSVKAGDSVYKVN